jgi:hypothetical protein
MGHGPNQMSPCCAQAPGQASLRLGNHDYDNPVFLIIRIGPESKYSPAIPNWSCFIPIFWPTQARGAVHP